MIMKPFITGLQFLTRIRIFKKCDFSPEDFGRSVKFFPLIGAIVGIFLAGVNLIFGQYLPSHALAALILLAGLFLTGGLHCDGLMDTADGVFSGRPRDRMLEIMKDSRVGANGVMAFGILLLLKFSIILDMPPAVLSAALFIAPVVARLAMVISVTSFPYARADGMGKAFAQFSGSKTLAIALALTLLLLLPFGQTALLSALGGILFSFFLACRFKNLLGGLTGDIYGAITECCEVITLFGFLILTV